jgi:hypothetical protein
MPTDTSALPEASNGHGPRGSHGHEASGEARNEARGNPFHADPNRPDDEFTQIRIPRGLVRQFNDWYEGQAPDARQRVSKDHYYQVAFRLGLEWLQKELPPVKSLDERLAEKLGKGQKP